MVKKIKQLLLKLKLMFSKKARLQALADSVQATLPKPKTQIRLFRVRTLSGETYMVPHSNLSYWREFIEVPATYNGAVLNSMLKEATIYPISQIAYMTYAGYIEE